MHVASSARVQQLPHLAGRLVEALLVLGARLRIVGVGVESLHRRDALLVVCGWWAGLGWVACGVCGFGTRTRGFGMCVWVRYAWVRHPPHAQSMAIAESPNNGTRSSNMRLTTLPWAGLPNVQCTLPVRGVVPRCAPAAAPGGEAKASGSGTPLASAALFCFSMASLRSCRRRSWRSFAARIAASISSSFASVSSGARRRPSTCAPAPSPSKSKWSSSSGCHGQFTAGHGGSRRVKAAHGRSHHLVCLACDAPLGLVGRVVWLLV